MSHIINKLQDYFMTGEKEILLDPLGCVLRLGMLSFQPIGTKISLHNNRIILIPPNNLQGIIRWANGDQKTDLHNIKEPLIKYIQWYNEQPFFEYISNKAIDGLRQLQDTYSINHLMVHSIEHYILILTKKADYINESSKLKPNPLEDSLKDIWSEDDFILILTLMRKIETTTEPVDKTAYYEALEKIIELKEGKINNKIIKYTSSFETFENTTAN
jgi:hypothetical protein